eukprot:CAMPEP_0115193572 /NCGR_PEP_ID=MMETSP0270-20121206/13627_1 /TAXON_ID=71861 /ORGANISM="Scrippsiella trochoidea, Strain CCMP3099" /LENGTH=197 /DNA_ID=CAMNT_0002606853 /DNA_START=410 /DNA_END=1000 /DNA_ORIENTATION=-
MNNIYQGMLGDWCMMLFGSSVAGERLGSVFSLSRTISGAVVTPLLAYLSDKLGVGLHCFFAIAVTLSIMNVFTVGLTTWSAQIVTAISMCLSYTTFMVLTMRYLLAFLGKELLGSSRGLMSLGAALLGFPSQALMYDLIAQLPDTEVIHLRLPLQVAFLFSAIVTSLWSAHVLYTGLPSRPLIYDRDANGAAASALD